MLKCSAGPLVWLGLDCSWAAGRGANDAGHVRGSSPFVSRKLEWGDSSVLRLRKTGSEVFVGSRFVGEVDRCVVPLRLSRDSGTSSLCGVLTPVRMTGVLFVPFDSTPLGPVIFPCRWLLPGTLTAELNAFRTDGALVDRAEFPYGVLRFDA